MSTDFENKLDEISQRSISKTFLPPDFLIRINFKNQMFRMNESFSRRLQKIFASIQDNFRFSELSGRSDFDFKGEVINSKRFVKWLKKCFINFSLGLNPFEKTVFYVFYRNSLVTFATLFSKINDSDENKAEDFFNLIKSFIGMVELSLELAKKITSDPLFATGLVFKEKSLLFRLDRENILLPYPDRLAEFIFQTHGLEENYRNCISEPAFKEYDIRSTSGSIGERYLMDYPDIVFIFTLIALKGFYDGLDGLGLSALMDIYGGLEQFVPGRV